MTPAPSPDENDAGKNDDGRSNNHHNGSKANSTTTPSSWFGSWFERGDMRDEIHEQLNQFEEQTKRYEEELREQQKIWQSAFPFPFFGPPPPESSSADGDGDGDYDSRSRHPSNRHHHHDEWEDFFGGGGGGHHRSPFGQNDPAGGERRRWNHNNDHDDEYERSIREINREMKNFFERAFGGGMPPEFNQGWGDPQQQQQQQQQHSGGNNNGIMPFSSSSSSLISSTIVSSSDGTSYQIQQDSRNGARIDVRLPRTSTGSNSGSDPDRGVTLEVLHERPCIVQWRKPPRDNDSNSNSNSSSNKHDENSARDWRHKPLRRPWEQHSPNQQQVVELGDSIDCSKLSASLSEASNILTVQAPIRRRDANGGGESKEALAPQLPRSVPVSKTD